MKRMQMKKRGILTKDKETGTKSKTACMDMKEKIHIEIILKLNSLGTIFWPFEIKTQSQLRLRSFSQITLGLPRWL